ncbi:hypothetical protein TNCV_4358381 [Trichonephila clavipes]|nr:hypothetical protein TNCV_4358381 [Trichonephila clavipes]
MFYKKEWSGAPPTSILLPPTSLKDLWLDKYLEYPHAAKALYIYKHPCLRMQSQRHHSLSITNHSTGWATSSVFLVLLKIDENFEKLRSHQEHLLS